MNYFRPLAVSVAALLPFVTPFLTAPAASGQTWSPVQQHASWGDAVNWRTPNTVPNSARASVTFEYSTGAILLDGNTYTVNELTFRGESQFTLSGGTIALAKEEGGPAAAINVGPQPGGDYKAAFFASTNLRLDTAATVNTWDPASRLLFEPGSSITGAGSLVKTGPGLLEINTASTYSGGTLLAGGRLHVGNNNALGTGTLTIQGGTTLSLAHQVSLANNIEVGGDFTLAGPAYGNAKLAGNIDLGSATRTITVTSGVGGTQFIAEVTGVISGSGGLTVTGVDGKGEFRMQGASGNTFTGLTTVGSNATVYMSKSGGFAAPGGALVQDGGFLAINQANQQINGTLNVQSGGRVVVSLPQTIDDLQGGGEVWFNPLILGASLTIRAGDFSGSLNHSSIFFDAPPLIKDGTGTFNFTGTSNYLGGTIVRGGGTLAVNSNAALGAAGGGLAIEGSRLRFLAGFNSGRAVTVTGAAEIDTDAFDSDLSGVISGTGILVKTGTGTLSLSGANTYAGGTWLNEGRLTVKNNNALGAGELMIQGGTTLELANGVSLANNIVVGGDFTLTGPAQGNANLSGNIDLGNATRTITVTSGVGGTQFVAEVTGVISGSGGLTVAGVDGGGEFRMGGASGNTFTGLTTVGPNATVYMEKSGGFAAPGGALVQNGGLLVITNTNQQINGTLNVHSGGRVSMSTSQTIDDLQGGGTVRFDSLIGLTLTIRAGDFSGSLNDAASLFGGVTLIKDGTGTFNFTGTSSYTGGTIVRGGGTLAVNSNAALGAASGRLTLDGSRLRFLAGFNSGRAVTVTGAAEIDTGTFTSDLSGVISGAGTLVKTGTGTLSLSGANTYTGGTWLNEGRLAVRNNNALGAGELVIQGGTTLELANGVSIANDVVVEGDFTMAGDGAIGVLTGNVSLSGATRTITAKSNLALNGVISDGGLTVTGAESSPYGILIGGSSGNTYTGLTTVGASGRLSLAKTEGFATPGGLLVQDTGGLLIHDSNQQISGTLTVQSNAVVEMHASQTIDDLQGSGTIHLFFPTENLTIEAGDFSGAITTQGKGGAGLVKEGLGTVTLPGNIPQIPANPQLIKDGPGTLNFTGSSDHTGGTLIRGGGTLAVNSDAALGAAGGEISFNTGTLELLSGFDIDRPVTLTSFGRINTNGYGGAISGVISGTGLLAKSGTGTLTLTGTNTYSGGTSIEGGVLEISSDANLGATNGDLRFYGGALRLLGNVTSARDGGINGRATIDTNGFNATFSGEFYGEGGNLRKIGSGTLTLTGNSGFYGDTYVQGGTLILNGSLSRDVIVGLEGGGQQPRGQQQIAPPIFGGTGTVRGNLINYSGIIAPGNSPGILNVGGDFTQHEEGTLQIEIAGRKASQYDQLMVGGEANLDGTVQFIALKGFRPRGGDRFVFLTAAGGINGTFSTVLLDAPLIAGRVDYTGTTATLSFARRPIVPIFNGGGDDDIIVTDAPNLPRLTTNQTAVAQVLDEEITSKRLDRVFGELDRFSLQGIPGALDLIAPEELSAIYEITIGSARVQAFNLDRHLSELRSGRSGFSADRFRLDAAAERSGKTVLTADGKMEVSGKDVFTPGPENRWSVFLSGSGEFLDIDGDANARGYDITTSGFTLGADYRVCEGFAVGILAGYAGTGTELSGDGHILVNSGTLGIYATGFNENLYVNALVAGGYNSYDIKRRALGGTTRGETDGGEFTGFLAVGYDVHSGALTWGPFAEVQYTYVGYAGFEERGSAAPLDIQSNHSDSLRTRLGARFSYQYQTGKVGIRPELRIGWQHEYLDRTRPTDSRFATGAGDVFRVEGPEIGRDSFIVNASVTLSSGGRFSTYLAYDGELGRNRYESHTFSGGVGIGF